MTQRSGRIVLFLVSISILFSEYAFSQLPPPVTSELMFTKDPSTARQRNKATSLTKTDPIPYVQNDFGGDSFRKNIADIERILLSQSITTPVELYDLGIKDMVSSYLSKIDSASSGCETRAALWAIYSQYRDKFEDSKIASDPDSPRFFYSILSGPKKKIIFFDVTEHNYLTIQRWVELKYNMEYKFPFSIGTTLLHVDNHPDWTGEQVNLDELITGDNLISKTIDLKDKKPRVFFDKLFKEVASDPKNFVRLESIKTAFPNINDTLIGACCTGISKDLIWINAGDATRISRKNKTYTGWYLYTEDKWKAEPDLTRDVFLSQEAPFISCGDGVSVNASLVPSDYTPSKDLTSLKIEDNFILDIDLDFFFHSYLRGCMTESCPDYLALMDKRIDWLISFLQQLKNSNKSPSVINFVYSSAECGEGICQAPIRGELEGSFGSFSPPCYVILCAYKLKEKLLKLYELKELSPKEAKGLFKYRAV